MKQDLFWTFDYPNSSHQIGLPSTKKCEPHYSWVIRIIEMPMGNHETRGVYACVCVGGGGGGGGGGAN